MGPAVVHEPRMLAEHHVRAVLGVPDVTADTDGLAALFRAWCRVVPYDTTRKLEGLAADPGAALWGLDPVELIDANVASGTGGTCFPLAAGFAAVARRCGFDAEVHGASSGSCTWADHAVVVVTIDDRAFLCDPSFLHLQPAHIPRRCGQRCIVGPLCAPLEVTRDEDGVRFAVQRGTSTETRWYVLRGALSGDELRDAYEHAGRHPSGLRPYVRLYDGTRQVVIDAAAVTLKGPGGLQRRTWDPTTRPALLAELTGWSADAVELLESQLAATS